ncbi:hypothetical protein QTH97_28180 [Variovorax sp. J22R24]|uniref:hypothetical protein n=1 Tax=Variovorax gracilis TaxID=3053502 RepID=UPI002577B088|nr:hypothetical protein [Variovorax sp. J22R24]MDM0108851.1 hypothetical protein [Variovorax sp. J22R24]
MEPMKPMEPMEPMKPMKPMAGAALDWWPASLGSPASSGAQDGWRYAFFPQARRLVMERDGRVTQYDTGDHAINGVSQRQDGSAEGPVFTSQHGTVDLASLDPLA